MENETARWSLDQGHNSLSSRCVLKQETSYFEYSFLSLFALIPFLLILEITLDLFSSPHLL